MKAKPSSRTARFPAGKALSIKITAERAVILISELSAQNDDATFRAAVLEIIGYVNPAVLGTRTK